MMVFNIPVVNLIHQVSDKRLLKRCGSGKSYLIETQSASFRPSGLRIRRAEVWTKGPRVPMFRRSTKTGNVLSEIESQGFRNEGLRPGLSETDARSSGKWHRPE